MVNLNIWDWKYRVFFEKETRVSLEKYINRLTLEEKDVYVKIRDFFLSFYSISLLLDAIERNTKKEREYISYAYENKHKIIYTPRIIIDTIKERINSSSFYEKEKLLELLSISQTMNPCFSTNQYYEMLYGYAFHIFRLKYVDKNLILLPIEHGEKIESINIEKDFDGMYNQFKNNTLLQSEFGVSKVKDSFITEVTNGKGYGEWWDRGLTNSECDKLILYKNPDSLNVNDLFYTILHEVYPGHGHFYNIVAHNEKYSFDHGAMSLIEGWATYVEWHSIVSDYVFQIRNNALIFLRESEITNIDERSEKTYQRKIQQHFSTTNAIQTVIYETQYRGYLESYYMGALWIEYFINVNKMTPKDFLLFLSDRNVGDLYSIWNR